ncbi:hypothetical protein GCM10012284_09710 [Mangrovihabitans endophyticus]|uniref:Uncharacterized protein n=2 Tax=Mangrovihabitans endophyticus TaxID=1751298 RepID=A0A8J3FLI1_9ACTN|nr:hypothetical protein GCM10012284_09710 [Mangrovihabitans endophyticus]
MDLGFAGQRILGHEFGYTIAFTVSGGYEVRVESPMRVRTHGIEYDVQPGADGGEAALDALTGDEVTAAVAEESGALRIDLNGGSRVVVSADPQFEAWTVAGPAGFKVVCGPGGDLSEWTARL